MNLKRLVSLAISVLAAAALAPGQTSHPTFWRYTHPDPQALLGLEVKQVLNSRLGQRIKKEFTAFSGNATVSMEGFDFLPDVDRVLVSSPAASETKSGASKQNPPVVIAMSGHFDIPKLRKLLMDKGGRRAFYKGAEIISPPPSKTDMAAGLVSGQIMLLGDPASIKAAIDHHENPESAETRNELFARAAELSKDYDFWIVSETSPDTIEELKSSPLGQLASSIGAFEGGISVRNGLRMEVSLDAEDEDAAKKLAALLQMGTQMAAAGVPEQQREQASDFLKRVKVGTLEGFVTISFAYTQPELDEGIDRILAATKSPQKTAPLIAKQTNPAAAAMTPVPEAVPARPSAPPPPLTIKIFNAEGGTREVPIR